jgi:CDP-4-dehydro-6-deoxyglucose reductase
MVHTVTIQPSGRTFQCDADTEILRAGLAAGLFLPYSCRSGVCNTCRGKVTQGEVDVGNVHPKYLSAGDRAAGYALLCQARPRSDVTIEAHEIDTGGGTASKFVPCRILELKPAAPDVMIVKLGLPMNEPLVYRAGQYIEFVGTDGTRRSYSIANTPQPAGVRSLELHIRHLPGGRFTDRVFSGGMKLREVHKAELPLGSFFLRDTSDKPIILLASGTGFAPIKAIVGHSLATGQRRPIKLYWGGRRRTDLYMHDLCMQWAREHDHIRYVPVLSDATSACHWEGRTGFVHKAVMQDHPDLSQHEVYACGAPAMVDAARRDFVETSRLPADAFFADSFLTAKEKAAA